MMMMTKITDSCWNVNPRKSILVNFTVPIWWVTFLECFFSFFSFLFSNFEFWIFVAAFALVVVVDISCFMLLCVYIWKINKNKTLLNEACKLKKKEDPEAKDSSSYHAWRNDCRMTWLAWFWVIEKDRFSLFFLKAWQADQRTGWQTHRPTDQQTL